MQDDFYDDSYENRLLILENALIQHWDRGADASNRKATWNYKKKPFEKLVKVLLLNAVRYYTLSKLRCLKYNSEDP